MVTSVFDPLGLLTPFILLGKRVLQETLKNLEKNSDTQMLQTKKLDKIQSVELHHFSDASNQGYGQCSYIRNKVHCTLIIIKARFAPTKVVTIPRLELTVAVISAAVSSIKQELELTGSIFG